MRLPGGTVPANVVVAFLLFIPLASPLVAQNVTPVGLDADAGAGEYSVWETGAWMHAARESRARRAALLLRSEPVSPATAAALIWERRYSDALQVLERVIDERPERVAETLRAFAHVAPSLPTTEEYMRFRDALPGAIARARARAHVLTKEAAAWVHFEALAIESFLRRGSPSSRREWQEAHDALAREYAGTEAGLEAELIAAVAKAGDGADPGPALDAFARAHPGTCGAAHALQKKAFHLAHNAPRGQPMSADPAPRLLEALSTFREMERLQPNRCGWVAREGRPFFSVFIPPSARVSRDKLARLIDELWEFATRQVSLAFPDPGDDKAAYLISEVLAGLHARLDPAGGEAAFERRLHDLEARVEDVDAVRFVRASYHIKRLREAAWAPVGPPGSTRQASDQDVQARKARDILTDLVANGRGLWSRKALATLASLLDFQGDHAAAREQYRKYLRLYPDSPAAWVAALRMGQCALAMGDRAGALESWRLPGREKQSAVARVLASVFTARALEADGEWDQARLAYSAAAASWEDGFGLRLELMPLRPAPGVWPTPATAGPWGATKDEVTKRVARLEKSLAVPGGRDLERGRWLLQERRWDEAIVVLESVSRQHRDTLSGREAGELLLVTRLERALALADVESPKRDAAAALAALQAIDAEPAGLVPVVAKVALACLAGLEGKTPEARAWLREGLDEWQRRQPAPPAAASLNALERDVIAIRDVVFRPLGDPVYRERDPNDGPWAGRWNGFEWPAALPPFVLVDPEVTVRLPDGTRQQVSVPQRFRGLENALLADGQMTRLLEKVIERLGGNRKRQPADVMDTPNQPAGPSLDVMALLNEFFPMRQGHWGGWVLRTYPIITGIEFADAARTRARVAVEIGYGGAEVILEKAGGAWKAVRLEHKWGT